MGNDGFDDDFYKIFKKYKLDSMDELNLRGEVQNYIKKRFVSKDKIKEKIESIENMSEVEVCDEEINYRLKIEDKAKKEVLKELLEEEKNDDI